MAPPPRIRHFLYKLDDIEKAARQRFPECSFLYLYNVTHEYVLYFREIVARHPEIINTPMLDALHFYFDEKLEQIFRSKGDFTYLAYEIDEQGIWPANHQSGRYSAWVSQTK